MRRIMVLGHADPVKTEFLDVLEPFTHPAIGVHSCFAVIGIGRHRPFCRQSARRTIMCGLEKRDFQGPAAEVVIPASAGIQGAKASLLALDPRFREGDE
jgi:hypothetical protein